MTETELRENLRGLDWNYVCGEIPLSIDFLRQMADNLNWDEITWNQVLTERQIEEFKDRIHNWYNVALNQDISREFLDKWKDMMSVYNK